MSYGPPWKFPLIACAQSANARLSPFLFPGGAAEFPSTRAQFSSPFPEQI